MGAEFSKSAMGSGGVEARASETPSHPCSVTVLVAKFRKLSDCHLGTPEFIARENPPLPRRPGVAGESIGPEGWNPFRKGTRAIGKVGLTPLFCPRDRLPNIGRLRRVISQRR